MEEDYAGWLLDQATALREHRLDSLDWGNVAEALEDMYAKIEADLASDIRVILEHLLKLQYEQSTNEWARNSRRWKLSTIEHRDRAARILKRSHKWRDKLPEFVAEEYPGAVQAVAIARSRRESDYPGECPWSTEQILDRRFFPDPFNVESENGRSD